MKKTEITTIPAYIETFPENIQKKLQEIYQIVHAVVPSETTEKINYQIPTFYLNGNLVHFAGYKSHIGFYPGANGVAHFIEQLADYKTSKGTIQFPIDQPLPQKLIQDITKFRVQENLSK